MASTIQLRVDDDLKNKSDELFKALGTDTTTAIRMFLTQAIAENGFPFAIKKVDSNPFRALSESEESLWCGNRAGSNRRCKEKCSSQSHG